MGKLTKCNDCGETISKKAKSCPHCGAPVKKSSNGCLTLLIIGIVGFWVIVFTGESGSNQFNGETFKVYTKGSLNVRSMAGTTHGIISTLSPGDVVEVRDSLDGWYRIFKEGGFFTDEIKGWVSKGYVSKYNQSEYERWKNDYDKRKRKEYEDGFANRDNKLMAYTMCEDWIKQHLKAPSTAEFPGVFDGRKDHVIKNGAEYTIKSYVDAQNSFGATVRTNFICITEQVSYDEWQRKSAYLLE